MTRAIGDSLFMATHHLICTLDLPLSPERIFPFFADAGNLERITPPELRFRILTPRPMEMRVGALIDYRLSLFGIPFSWKTRIAAWEPGRMFVDEQIRGPYAAWVHTHTFTATTEGTRILDEVEYALPLAPVGDIALPLVRVQLRRIFNFRQRQVIRAFGFEPSECTWQVAC
jgi:ligand-binding SRPBCC domain-containing protein